MNFHALFRCEWTIYLNTAVHLPFTALFINFFILSKFTFIYDVCFTGNSSNLRYFLRDFNLALPLKLTFNVFYIFAIEINLYLNY